MTNTLQLFLLSKRVYARDIINEILEISPKSLRFNLLEAIYVRFVEVYKKIIVKYHAMHTYENSTSIVACNTCFPLMSTLYGETQFSVRYVDEIIQLKIREYQDRKVKQYNCLQQENRNDIDMIEDYRITDEKNNEKIKSFLLEILKIHKTEYTEMQERLIILEKLTPLNHDFVAKFSDFNVEWSNKFEVIKTTLCTLLRQELVFLCTNDKMVNLEDLVNKRERNFMRWLNEDNDVKEGSELLEIIKFTINLLNKEERDILNTLIKRNLMICTNCLRDVIYNYDSLYVSYEDIESTIRMGGIVNNTKHLNGTESMETVKIQATPIEAQFSLNTTIKDYLINNTILKRKRSREAKKNELKKYEVLSLIHEYFDFLNKKLKLTKIYKNAVELLNKIEIYLKDFLKLYFSENPIYMDSLLINLVKIKGNKEILNFYTLNYADMATNFEKSFIYHLLIKFNEIDICRHKMLLLTNAFEINQNEIDYSFPLFYKEYNKTVGNINSIYEDLFINKKPENLLYCPLRVNINSSVLLNLRDDILFLFKNAIPQEVLETFVYHKMIEGFYSNRLQLEKDMKYWITKNKHGIKTVYENINGSIFIPTVDYNSNMTCVYNRDTSYDSNNRGSNNINSIEVRNSTRDIIKNIRKGITTNNMEDILRDIITNEAQLRYDKKLKIDFNKFISLFSVSEYSFLKIRIFEYKIILSLFQYELLNKLVSGYEEGDLNKGISKNSIEYHRCLFGLKNILISVNKNRAYLITPSYMNTTDTSYNMSTNIDCIIWDIRYITGDIVYNGIYRLVNELKRQKQLEIRHLDEDLIKECIAKGVGELKGDHLVYIP